MDAKKTKRHALDDGKSRQWFATREAALTMGQKQLDDGVFRSGKLMLIHDRDPVREACPWLLTQVIDARENPYVKGSDIEFLKADLAEGGGDAE